MKRFQQVIIIPIKNKVKINKLRKKFDPNYKKFKVHITLIYRFNKLDDKIIFNHILNSIKGIKPFEIVFKGYSKSAKEFYLYLDIKKGNYNLMSLHNRLKTGILKKVNNPRMPRYIPHISLGFFKTRKEIDNIIKKLPPKLEIKERVNRIQLLTIDKNRKIKHTKNFKLIAR